MVATRGYDREPTSLSQLTVTDGQFNARSWHGPPSRAALETETSTAMVADCLNQNCTAETQCFWDSYSIDA